MTTLYHLEWFDPERGITYYYMNEGLWSSKRDDALEFTSRYQAEQTLTASIFSAEAEIVESKGYAPEI